MPDFYAHQHSQSAHQPETTVVLTSSLYTRVGGAGGTSHAHEGVELARGSVFQDFQPPPVRDPAKLCAFPGGCGSYRMKDGDLCYGHVRAARAAARLEPEPLMKVLEEYEHDDA